MNDEELQKLARQLVDSMQGSAQLECAGVPPDVLEEMYEKTLAELRTREDLK